jgi:hypothetical protein
VAELLLTPAPDLLAFARKLHIADAERIEDGWWRGRDAMSMLSCDAHRLIDEAEMPLREAVLAARAKGRAMLTDAKIAAIKPPPSGQEEHPDYKVTGLRLRVGAGGMKTWIVRRRVGAKAINKKLGTYPIMGLGAARSAADKLLAVLLGMAAPRLWTAPSGPRRSIG